MNINQYLSSKNTNNILLAFILLAGGILRFYGYGDFSLSNDELSALNRLRFNTFHEMIEQGVMPDGHPPLVQVFLFYWIKAFGTTEASVRFPFVFAGIIGIYFLYLIGVKWFNPTTALLAASGLAFLEFPLMYTRIARPYSPGLLFTLMNVWFWTELLFNRERKKWPVAIFYGMTAALCMYTHYFSFLSALLTGITGLFFIRKDNFKQYLLGGGIAAVLFIPALGIFHHQFFETGGLGGPTGWLGKPKPDFFRKFLFQCFNFSNFVYYFAWGALFLSAIVYITKIRISRFHALSLLWFLLPFFIGYYYSIYRSAVLQDKLMLFSYPFLLLFVFSFFQDESRWTYKAAVVFISGGVFLGSTFAEKAFFKTQYFDQFNRVADNIIASIDAYGEKNITKTVNIHHPYYIDYYLNRSGRNVSFVSYRNDAVESFLRFDSILRRCSTPYFLYAWGSTFSPCELLQIIKEYYPYAIRKEYYNRSEFYLFSKQKPGNYSGEQPLFFSKNDFEAPAKFWNTNEQALADSPVSSGNKSAVVNRQFPFSPTFSAKAREIFRSVDDILYVGVKGYTNVTGKEVKICLSFETDTGSYEWHDMLMSNFIDSAGTWKSAYLFCRVPELKSGNDIIKIFVWNLSDAAVYIDDFKVWTEKGNPIIYGKRLDSDILEE